MSVLFIGVECGGCGGSLRAEFQSANMLLVVETCHTCKAGIESDALDAFFKDLMASKHKIFKKIEEMVDEVAKKHDIL